MRALSLCIALMLSSFAFSENAVIEFVGDAYDIDTGELLYKELHQLTVSAKGEPISEVVTYVRADGVLIGEKTLDYQSAMAPNYRVNYQLAQKTEAVIKRDNRISIDAAKPKTLDAPNERLFAIDGGFHYLIVNQFDTLSSGQSIEFDFLSAGRGTFFGMQIKPTQRETTLELELSLANFFFSALVKPIQLTYDSNTRQLIEYKGLTNIPGADGRLLSAVIRYTYAPSSNIGKLASLEQTVD